MLRCSHIWTWTSSRSSPPSPHTFPPLCSGFPIIFVSWRVSSCSIRVMFCFLLRGQSQCPRCRFPPFYIMLSVIVKNAQTICAHVLSLSVDGERHWSSSSVLRVECIFHRCSSVYVESINSSVGRCLSPLFSSLLFSSLGHLSSCSSRRAHFLHLLSFVLLSFVALLLMFIVHCAYK